ncbi:intelectin-1a-like [Branchiostoma floridae]|uniref:Intelectin-1a-like n=1 Tax=Branchiostoma floridae TaxID=7739 RepID=A0A9J7MDG6_BRAFL|nr:intelectin-1a-like [Branchiostoma floridae]
MSEEKVRIRRMAHEPRSDRLSPAVGFAVCSLAVTVAVLLVTFLHSGQVQQSDVASLRERLASVENELSHWKEKCQDKTSGQVQQSERLASLEKELGYWREKSQSLLERVTVVETKMQDGFWTGQTSTLDTEADSLLTPGGPKTSDSGATGAEKDKDVPRIRSKRQAVSANTVRLPISGCMQGPPGPPGAVGRDGRDGVQGPPGPAGCGFYGEGVQRQIATLERGLDDVENKTSQTERRLASLEGQQQEEIGSVTNPAVSCKYIKDNVDGAQDGLYHIRGPGGVVYETYCDMTIAGGGWTLVSSVHENDIYGKCTAGDRWSSTRGSTTNYPKGDGNWANYNTFGSAALATNDDLKNPGYFSIDASDVMLWHVPNDTPLSQYKSAAYLRYHTTNGFLQQYGGNMYSLFKDHFPIVYNGGTTADNGPAIPITWDRGSNGLVTSLIAPNSVAEVTPGFVQFRVFNTERAPLAVCPGVRYNGFHSEHVCIGGAAYWPEVAPRQCGDFSSRDWDGYGTHTGWSSSRLELESAVLFFYR